ncbi:hypothetical protein [Desulfocurvus sp.]|jgi:hypothetical protein|uniref:hypothetical protein n=1 Tax=Desulfocurvus sp. TaxID=2871698 RepID=UPI0025C58098|nr:hypothetical protein [Desulfocurvus sp.]MCK9239201.1 hypothetical protein [Desulfocurvus sp.]
MTVSQSSITSLAARGSFLRQGLKGLCKQERTRKDMVGAQPNPTGDAGPKPDFPR